MIRFLFILALVFFVPCFAHEGETDLLGITTRWESPERAVASQLEREMTRLSTEAAEFYDPDCLFRKPDPSGRCRTRFADEAQAVSDACAAYQKETLGFFDIHHRRQTPAKRDFGGVWQGHAIDTMKALLKGAFIVDFSGDIFLSAPEATEREIVVTDPVLDELKFAEVRINCGFVMTSVSRRLGGKVRVPDALAPAKSQKGEVLKVVLFAKPDFSGARLDAWSTAIVAGGTKVLHHLETLEPYQGQWEYFYFEPNGTAHVSAVPRHLKYEVEGSDRVITVEF